MGNTVPVLGRYRLSPQQSRIWRNAACRRLPPSAIELSVAPAVSQSTVEAALAKIVARHEILRTSFDVHSTATVPLQTVFSSAPVTWSADTSNCGLCCCWMGDDTGGKRLRIIVPPPAADVATLLMIGRELIVQLREELISDEPIQYTQFTEYQQEMLDSGERIELPPDLSPWTTSLPRFERVSRDPGPLNSVALLETNVSAMPLGAHMLLACLCSLIARWSGSDAAHVWIECGGRNEEELASVSGPVGRWLPMSVPHLRDVSWQTFVADVRAAADLLNERALSYTYEELPPPGESLGIGFQHHGIPPELYGQVANVTSCSERFDVRVSVIESNGRLTSTLHYDSTRVSEAAASDFVSHFKRLVQHAASKLGLLLRDSVLVTIEDYRRSLPDRDLHVDPAIVHQSIHANARSMPTELAVVGPDGQLRYDELSDRAKRLACRLQQLGAGPDRIVAIYLDRGCRAIIAMLGSLTSGAAYLVLDPEYPVQWTIGALERSRAVAIVTDHLGTAVFRDSAWADRVVPVNAAGGILLSETLIRPSNLAYVVFTSGSTGEPKGVMVEHRHLASYTRAIVDFLRLAPGMRFAVVTTFAADLANTGIFGALASGGTLHILSKEQAADGARLEEYLRTHRIDCIKIVPSHLRALTQSGAAVRPERYLMLGGEATPREWIDPSRLAPASVVNHYGPAEATVGALAYHYDPAVDPQSPVIPLGESLSNAHAHLLDGDWNPVPDGAPGEIYLGGAAIARGYLDTPGLTAERFLPDPFSDQPGARLYRTGDRARKLPTGRLVFLGRTDTQLKIRGYRVEIGEIERALCACPRVCRAAVLVDRREDDAPVLIACVEASNDGVSARALREHLGSRLPGHMIPATIDVVSELPLNANGKLDRMRVLERVRKAGRGGQPSNPFERIVADIWAGVLSSSGVGADDNFFDIGGHSLLAMTVVSRVRRVFRVDATPRDLFDNPTVGQFCDCLRKKEPRLGHIDEITRIVLNLQTAATAAGVERV